MILDFNGFGRIVQQISGLRLHFLHDITTRREVGNGNVAAFIGMVFAAGFAYDCAVCFRDFENDIRKRLFRDGIHLFQEQSAERFILDRDFAGFAGFNVHDLRSIIQTITVLCLRFHNRVVAARDVVKLDHAAAVRSVNVARISVAIAAFDFKLYAGKRFARHAVNLCNHETALFRIRKIQNLRVICFNHHGLRRCVQNIVVKRLRFAHNIRARFELGKDDFAVFIGRINPVGGSQTFIIWDKLTVRSGDLKLNTRQHFSGLTVGFDDNQISFRFIEHLKQIRLVIFDSDGLRGIIQNIARFGLRFLHDIRARGKVGDGNITIRVCTELPVGSAYRRTVCGQNGKGHI